MGNMRLREGPALFFLLKWTFKNEGWEGGTSGRGDWSWRNGEKDRLIGGWKRDWIDESDLSIMKSASVCMEPCAPFSPFLLLQPDFSRLIFPRSVRGDARPSSGCLGDPARPLLPLWTQSYRLLPFWRVNYVCVSAIIAWQKRKGIYAK